MKLFTILITIKLKLILKVNNSQHKFFSLLVKYKREILLNILEFKFKLIKNSIKMINVEWVVIHLRQFHLREFRKFLIIKEECEIWNVQ